MPFLLKTATASSPGEVIQISAKGGSILQGEEMPALAAKVSLETESKKDRKLDDSGFTVQDLAKQLESGEGYTLVCEADPDTEGEYPVEVVLNEEIRKKLEKDWVGLVQIQTKDAVFQVKNPVGDWDGTKFKKYDGSYVTSDFVVSLGKTYYFDKEGEKVTGCICETSEGYVQYNASKGVVLCTGDIGGNLEMCKAYAPICVEYGQPRSQYTPVGVNTGDGHKMGMWAGAQLQDLPFPTMMHPQAFCWFHGPFLFVNDNGERFMCEDTWVQGKSLAINRQPNGEAWSIFDANWETDLVDGLPYGGGMFWDSFRPYGSDLSLAPEYFKTQIPTYIESGMAYQADTLDELAEKIGCDAETFKATVERYNGMCEAGEDTDYYKKPVFLTPVKEGPFYALKVGPALLAVTGGLKTNVDFQCLDAEGKPIEGLYALGNCQGDITAVDYPINVAGNSHGRCITYGYLLGRDLAKA